jgi:hypothetical protein
MAIGYLVIHMTTKQERRDSDRAPSMRACPYELTKLEGSAALKSSKGYGYSINMSPGGMLILLPQKVDKRQVFEVQVPSKTKKKERTKLVEVRWTQPIPVSARVKMYLVGARFLFEPPTR